MRGDPALSISVRVPRQGRRRQRAILKCPSGQNGREYDCYGHHATEPAHRWRYARECLPQRHVGVVRLSEEPTPQRLASEQACKSSAISAGRKNTEISRNSGKKPATASYYVTKAGRGGLTFAHPVLALDYAEYLDAAIGVEVREVFLQTRADDISLANDIMDRITEQVREDELRVQVRQDNTARNKELARQGAKAGCAHRYDYADFPFRLSRAL